MLSNMTDIVALQPRWVQGDNLLVSDGVHLPHRSAIYRTEAALFCQCAVPARHANRPQPIHCTAHLRGPLDLSVADGVRQSVVTHTRNLFSL